jgi:hypothetical protein
VVVFIKHGIIGRAEAAAVLMEDFACTGNMITASPQKSRERVGLSRRLQNAAVSAVRCEKEQMRAWDAWELCATFGTRGMRGSEKGVRARDGGDAR